MLDYYAFSKSTKPEMKDSLGNLSSEIQKKKMFVKTERCGEEDLGLSRSLE